MATSKTRRTHNKSRDGCFECKRRKQKCNENKPICGGCTRRELPCIYRGSEYPTPTLNESGRSSYAGSRDISPLAAPLAGESSHPSSKMPLSPCGRTSIALTMGESNSHVPENIEHPLGQFDVEDMILWHHFITVTASTLSSPWHVSVPTLATSHSFLLHGILAAAALHLAHLNPSNNKSYIYRATYHQSIAVGPFRQAVSNITSENCSALFAFSALLVIFSITSISSPSVPFFDQSAEYEGISRWIVFLRGCSDVFLAGKSHIENGPLLDLIERGRFPIEPEINQETLEDHILCQLSRDLLVSTNVCTSSSEEQIETYRTSIEELRRVFAMPWETDPIANLKVLTFAWPMRIPQLFVRLLSEERPPALVIMAYFCVLLKKCDECWYMKGKADDIFKALQKLLSPEWDIYLEWPRNEGGFSVN